ncbi:hypothetical protein HWV62_39904 [Athelia sp. TMB]|nr:hypothetical protein HWV62_39904 [Athelia sp. TMB]
MTTTASRRGVPRVFLIPALAAALLLIAYYKNALFGDWLSPSSLCAVVSPQRGTSGLVGEGPKTVLSKDTDDYFHLLPNANHSKHTKPTHEHLLRPDGLMEVNPDGRHPLFALIEAGHAEWAAKVGRQSRTFSEAVKEYRRRHGRAPPIGFDAWWDYCQTHAVQLPDEYDQIYRDLEPFWGMDPQEMRMLQAEHESLVDSYTIGKDHKSDPVSVLKVCPALVLPLSRLTSQTSFSDGASANALQMFGDQAEEMISTLKPVQQHIPPFRAVFSPHDNPNLLTDWEVKNLLIEAAEAGTHVDPMHLPEAKLNGWLAACDPHSPARNTPFDIHIPPSAHNKTFIYDHLKVMDPCLHPSLLHHSGQFVSWDYGPPPERLFVPQFSYSSTPLHHDIVTGAPNAWVADTDPKEDLPWEQKVEERLLWRGSTTGMWASADTRWRSQQRVRLVQLTNERFGNLSVLPPRETRDERVGAPEAWAAARVNPAMMDVVFAGEPNSCEDATCDEMLATLPFRGRMGLAEAGLYKYVFDVDGNGWSSRYKRLLVSRSLIFKATAFPEWFAGRIQEYVHYIPIQMDYSDLHDAFIFFRGDLKGDFGHDDLAKKIAEQGREWALNFWRLEDLTAYNFRLMLEYARLLSLDREAMSYGPPELDVTS